MGESWAAEVWIVAYGIVGVTAGQSHNSHLDWPVGWDCLAGSWEG